MKEYLLWIDIETSGLDYKTQHILELAYVLTDFDVKNIYSENNYVIKPQVSYELLISKMDQWCINQHTNSGLLQKVKASNYTLLDVENNILEILNKNIDKDSVIYLAGNSVHFDKLFIDIYMKNLSFRISHRILDVSSFAIACKHLNVEKFEKKPLKKYKHTALSDIWESINEYCYYVENFLETKP